MDLLLAMITATAILVAIPGPTVALIVANTLKYGFQIGLVTVMGTTLGVGVQLGLVVTGLSAILEIAASAMLWIKWLGAAYLIYLGIQTWREKPIELSGVSTDSRQAFRIFWQGAGFALINPKTLLFNAAFLPQFLEPGAGASNLVVLATLYLSIFIIGNVLWTASAHKARSFTHRFAGLRNQLTGSIFVTSGVGLALARIDK